MSAFVRFASRSVIAALLLTLPLACATTDRAAEARAAALADDPDALVLREADEAFAADAAARGLEGWLHWFTPGAVKLGLDTELTVGHDAIAEADAPLFADPAVRITWRPDVSAWLDPGARGFTRGTWAFTRHETDGSSTKVAGGRYVTLWVLTPDGWRCELDLGAPD